MSLSHRMSKTPEYKIWAYTKARCYNKKHKNYNDYGGRGIIVCERWLNSFKNFYEDMGKRPSDKHSIERKNNNLNYSPENCYWATRKEQANNRRSNHLIEYKGRTQTVSMWADEIGIDKKHLLIRINSWGIEKAFNEPIKKPTLIEFNKEIKTIKEWANIFNINKCVLRERILKMKWPIERALKEPVKSKRLSI